MDYKILKLTSKLIITVLTGTLIIISSCKKEVEPCCDANNPECSNYDPCLKSELPNANIIMEAGSDLFATPSFFQDSVFVGYYIYFRSIFNNPNVKHRWYLGTEMIEGTSSLSRNFAFVSRPATLSITHVIEYSPNLECFPMDDGYDSITETFYLIDKHSELRTTGTFRGVIEGQTDSFDITFFFQRHYAPIITDPKWNEWNGSQIDNIVVNFNNNGDTLGGFSNTHGMFVAHFNHNLYFEYDYLYGFYGTGYVDDYGNIELNYGNNENTPTDEYIKFIGKKID